MAAILERTVWNDVNAKWLAPAERIIQYQGLLDENHNIGWDSCDREVSPKEEEAAQNLHNLLLRNSRDSLYHQTVRNAVNTMLRDVQQSGQVHR